jgi:Domain of unknown function (DUF4123)
MLSQREISEEHLGQLADGGHLFAVIDACGCHQGVMEKACHEPGPSKAICLFQGTYMAGYDAVAPYLFSVERRLLEWIENNLEKESWGIFVLAKASLMELQGHMRRFLLALLPDQHKWFFRYYDPRILRAYLPTCNAAELHMFFGPIRGFAARSPGAEKIFLFEQSTSAAEQVDANRLHPSGLWFIRPEQFHALSKASKEHFVQQMAAHVREFFPEACSRMSQSEFEQRIHHGMAKAALHGITAEQHVCRYLDLMFALGPNFDQEHRWAADVLTDRSIGLSSEKLERLYEAARRFEAEKGAADV